MDLLWECAKCGALNRYSQTHCHKCGTDVDTLRRLI